MNRIEELRRHIAPNARGVEIGAYYNPITPRSQGFRAVHLDLLDGEVQRERATADPHLTAADVERIEPVELVGSAVNIADLVTAKYGAEEFDYVVSSHNLEHLPNPIKFLQGCQQILRSGGVLSMALPDLRYCFDFYRTRTEVAEWLEAYEENRTRPTRAQLFQWQALASNVEGNATWDASASSFPVPWDLMWRAVEYWEGTAEPEFLDAHCWVFTPASFRLLIEDLRHLGFHQFDVESISPPSGCEFFVHLRHAPGSTALDDAEPYADRRARTMRQMVEEAAEVTAQFAVDDVESDARESSPQAVRLTRRWAPWRSRRKSS
ncbi:MAG: methyltransferase domain-containing protein [Aeromicrobium sp.]